MEKIATDIYSFGNLRKDGFVYVDKTNFLWRLVAKNEGRQFFISRPRRFGKSLMLSTLKCIFEGKRELFKGLKIDKLDYDWAKYPVVTLNMADVVAPTVDKLRENLLAFVKGLIRSFRLKDVEVVSEPGMTFGNFLKALAAKAERENARKRKGKDAETVGDGLVVLVDEYDVPLQGFFGDRKSLVAVREMMHDFYIQLKNNEANIRFLMLTGVTKLTKVSVFSGLNHLTDLTMKRKEYAAMLGYTPKEIAAFFPHRLDALAKKRKTDRKGALKLLLDWYDSYRFAPDTVARVCNPISIGQALQTGNLKSYWVGTAVATPVMERIAAAGDVDPLVNETLYRVYAKIPPEWKIRSEADVKRHFRLFMEMLGAKVAAEEGSARGYADAILETKKFVWIFEFKFNKSAKTAIEQIRRKGYADPYKGDRRPVTLVGINFRTAKRNIDEPLFAKLRARRFAGCLAPVFAVDGGGDLTKTEA